jgi:hypothetical protein
MSDSRAAHATQALLQSGQQAMAREEPRRRRGRARPVAVLPHGPLPNEQDGHYFGGKAADGGVCGYAELWPKAVDESLIQQSTKKMW